MLNKYEQIVQQYKFLFSKEVALKAGEKIEPRYINFKSDGRCKHMLKRTEVTCPSYVNPNYSTIIKLKYLIIFDICRKCLGGFIEFIPNRKTVLEVIAK